MNTNDVYNIPNLKINIPENKKLNLNQLINYLKELGFNLYDKMLFYYDPISNINTYLGNDPLLEIKEFDIDILAY